MRRPTRLVAAVAATLAASLMAISTAACDSGGPVEPSPAASSSPGAAVSQLGPRLEYGLGYRQDESGVIVVHLRGGTADMHRQAGALLAQEIGAYKATAAHNRQIDAASNGSGYAAWGAEQLWSGSTFDSSGLGAQDRYRVVYIVRPDNGMPFVSVSWPSAGGAEWVRSAMNTAGISLSYFHVTANREGAGGAAQMWRTLATVVSRARTIDQAIAMLAASPRTTSANVVIGDGRRLNAVVVELTPRSLAVRRPTADAIWATDHLVATRPGTAIRDDSSIARYRRLGVLVGDGTRRLTPALAVGILRDHFDERTSRSDLTGDVIASYANVQADVFNPTRGTFWIATGTAPAVYGAWAGFNLAEEVAARPSAARVMTLPADPELSQPESAGFRSFEQGYVDYINGDLSTATASLNAAVQSDLKNSTYRFVLGFALLAGDKAATAATAFRAAIGGGLDPLHRAIAYGKLGAIYQALGERRRSLEAYRAVLALKTGVAALEAQARAALTAPATPKPTPTPTKTPTHQATPTPTTTSQ